MNPRQRREPTPDGPLRKAAKRVLSEERRRWLRAAASGNPYRFVRPDRPVRIGEVVSPLRYDVMIRVRHFARHAERLDLYAADFDEYERVVRGEAYYVWFTRSRVPTWWPWLLRDPEGLDRAWRERLRASAALFESFAARGFDRAHPIELHTARRVRETATGKRVSRPLHCGDGNHRLSLLLATGQEFLAPDEYVVKRYRSLVPSDSTGVLLRETDAAWDDYRSFIELGYPGTRLTMEGGRVRVDSADPSEVSALVQRDLPYLAGVAE